MGDGTFVCQVDYLGNKAERCMIGNLAIQQLDLQVTLVN